MARREIVFCNAVRTTIRIYVGTLRTMPATALGTVAIKAMFERSGLDPSRKRE